MALGGVMYNFLDDNEAAAVVHRAIDLGVNYIDTAYGYQDSEQKIGLVMAERRDEVYLATKTERRDRDAAAREIDEGKASRLLVRRDDPGVFRTDREVTRKTDVLEPLRLRGRERSARKPGDNHQQ